MVFGQEDTVLNIGEYFTVEDVDLNSSLWSGPGFAQWKDNDAFALAMIERYPLKVSVRVARGVLTMRRVGGVTVLRGDAVRGDAELVIQGSLANVKASIMDIQYTPDSNFYGIEVVVITVNDLGSIGYGGPKELIRRIVIAIAAVEDPPVILLPDSLSLLHLMEDTTGVIGTECCVWPSEYLDHRRHNGLVGLSTSSLRITDEDLTVAPSLYRFLLLV